MSDERRRFVRRARYVAVAALGVILAVVPAFADDASGWFAARPLIAELAARGPGATPGPGRLPAPRFDTLGATAARPLASPASDAAFRHWLGEYALAAGDPAAAGRFENRLRECDITSAFAALGGPVAPTSISARPKAAKREQAPRERRSEARAELADLGIDPDRTTLERIVCDRADPRTCDAILADAAPLLAALAERYPF